MKKDSQYLKVSTKAGIFFTVLLFVAAFFSGAAWIKIKDGSVAGETANSTNAATFAATKSQKPEFQFFVMSFCPYGNQAEDVIRPVFDLLSDKVDIKPQYIFDKITDLGSYCKSRTGDATQCAAYVQSGYFTDEATCKKTIQSNFDKCNDEKAYIKANNGTYYGALHGRVEANQNVREICAWNQVEDKKIWWDFIANVNQNCDSQNADTCWEDQAKKAGLDTNKITECFNQQGIELIEKEIAQTEKFSVTGSPTLLVNGVNFPPESAYAQDGNGSLKIGKVVVGQADFRTPNTIKEAICASFDKAPKECKTELENPQGTNAAASAGGC